MNNFEKIQTKELLVLTLALAMPLVVLSMIFFNDRNPEILKEEVTNNLIESPEKYDISPDIMGKSAMVTELNSGRILYRLNEKEKRPIASITKLMTVLIANEKFKDKEINEVEINGDHLTAFGDSGLVIGQIWNVQDLIDFTLISSSNDGAKALAMSAFDNNETNFIAEMNNISRKMGLANTYFSNETGLDIDLNSKAGAISTAEDVTKILRYIALNRAEPFLASSKNEESIIIDGVKYDVSNTNKIIDKLPGALISKTGYTDLAGGNLAIVADFGLNNPVSIVVLGSTMEEREADIEKLYNETLRYYSSSLR